MCALISSTWFEFISFRVFFGFLWKKEQSHWQWVMGILSMSFSDGSIEYVYYSIVALPVVIDHVNQRKLSHILWLLVFLHIYLLFFCHWYYSTHPQWVGLFHKIIETTKKHPKNDPQSIYINDLGKKCPKTKIDDIKISWLKLMINAIIKILQNSITVADMWTDGVCFFAHIFKSRFFNQSRLFQPIKEIGLLVNNQAIRVNFMEFDWFFNAIGECLLAIWLNLRSNECDRNRLMVRTLIQ